MTKHEFQRSLDVKYLDAKKLKISMIGNMAVGKSCLSLRFVQNKFMDSHKATITDVESKAVKIHGDYVIFQVWDTAGQERFRSLLPLYMKAINGAVVVYDVTDKASFVAIKDWIAEMRKHAPEEALIMLVGNKVDLVKEEDNLRQVSHREGQDFATEHDLLFTEASAKSGENVDKLFVNLGKEILRNEVKARMNYTDVVDFTDSRRPTRRKCCASS